MGSQGCAVLLLQLLCGVRGHGVIGHRVSTGVPGLWGPAAAAALWGRGQGSWGQGARGEQWGHRVMGMWGEGARAVGSRCCSRSMGQG